MASAPRLPRAARALAGLVLAALALAAPGSARAQSVVVGGKDFTEQLLMAEMTAQLLASRGVPVRTRSGLSTSGIRREHEAGLLDLYWEYTGTALLIFNGVPGRFTPEEAYARVKALDGARGLVWLKPSGVNNTYALAMRRDAARARGVASISDLADLVRRGEGLRFACNTEFFIRPDGLLPLQRAYAFEFGARNVARMDTDAIYGALRDGDRIDVGLVFSTDGRVAAYDFVTLADDRGFFPGYILAPVVRRATLERHPGLAAPLEALATRLDDATIARLNAQVDVERASVEAVASRFLKEQGLVP